MYNIITHEYDLVDKRWPENVNFKQNDRQFLKPEDADDEKVIKMPFKHMSIPTTGVAN